MSLRRGFTLTPGERVVVVEDVITTGGSTKEVIDIVRAAGAIPVAAGSIIDRSGGAVDLGIPRAALETLKVITWQAEECPLCRAGEPVVKPGSRPA
jgi:orotate phosphoribosyltransferase